MPVRVHALLLLTALALSPLVAHAERPPPEVAAKDLREGPEGLSYADLVRGEGEPQQAGARLPVSILMWADPTGDPVSIGSPAEPLEVVVGGGSLIRGLDVGIVGMRPGGTRYLDIPTALTSGSGAPMIAVVHVFSESELQEIQSATTAATADSRPATGNRQTAIPASRTPPESPPTVADDDWTIRKNGLQLYDIEEGSGAELDKGMTLTVEYTGWVADSGLQFDSSLARAQPFQFTMGAQQVILGWDKGLKGMKVGGTRVLKIPAYLGYGGSGAGSIPPHADLLFLVQVLDAR